MSSPLPDGFVPFLSEGQRATVLSSGCAVCLTRGRERMAFAYAFRMLSAHQASFVPVCDSPECARGALGVLTLVSNPR